MAAARKGVRMGPRLTSSSKNASQTAIQNAVCFCSAVMANGMEFVLLR